MSRQTDTTFRTAFYVESSPDTVLVHLHEPARSSGEAVVMIVPGFGWEDAASAAVRREWADELAAGGHPALRIDLPGAGDSAGGPSDPDRLAAWTNAVSNAAAALRSRFPTQRIVAIGLGLGGLLAWEATVSGAAIDDLVLWGVPSRGRALVRELRAFAALDHEEAGDAPDAAFAAKGGAFSPAGYLMSEETATDLERVDIADSPLPVAPSRRLLVIGRDGLGVDPRLRQHAERIGLPCTEIEGVGWAAMMRGPHASLLPEELLQRISEWIDSGPSRPIAATPEARRDAEALSLPGALERPCAAGERAGTRFGVLTEPLESGSRKFGVLLLSGGVSHGPSRMWVEAARRWAPRGVPVVRLEVEEDERPDPDPYVREEELYDRRFAVQASEAVADLVQDGVADRWLVAGLCAGASWAFHAALMRPRQVSAVVLINPFVFDWEDDVAMAAVVGRTRNQSALDNWKRVSSGAVTATRIRAIAGHAVRSRLEWRRRRRRAADRVRREVDYLDSLRSAGTSLTFLVGQDEPIMDRFQDEGLLDELGRWPNLQLRRIPSHDHAFRALNVQELVHRELDAAIGAELERLSGVRTPNPSKTRSTHSAR